MRWPYPRFFQSSLRTIILVGIVASLGAFPPLEFSPEPVRATIPPYSAGIIDFAFQPQRINVTTGTEVIWMNRGNTQHTITSSPQSNTTAGGTPLISSGPLNPGQNFSYIFYKHGFYPIQCAFHPIMNGLINVTGSDVQPPPLSPTSTPLIDYAPLIIGGAMVWAIVIIALVLFLRRRTPKPASTAASGFLQA